MRFFPILEELLSSDTVIFGLIGCVIAAIIGIRLRMPRKNLIGMGFCLAIYALCELLSAFHVNYMLEFILLFGGTLALGGLVGFAIGCVVSRIRKK